MYFNEVSIRTSEFKRNDALESYLQDINMDLWKVETELLSREIKEYPVIFIMGALRTGTTLLEQWLASTGEFAYPSNMLSRFYGAPIVGSRIQKLLTDPRYSFRNEITEFGSDFSFESSNGKTKGALEPNEFWYFWRRFLPEDIWNYDDEKLMKYVDVSTFKKEMWGIANEFRKPLALKGMICNYNIGFLDKIFEKAIFIWIKRDLNKNIKSVLEARKRQYGTYNQWYSFRIPEYDELIKIDNMEEQVRTQINCINKAVERGLESVNCTKKISITYEKFCQYPKDLYVQIYEKLKEQGYIIGEQYNGIEKFAIR